MHSLRSAAVQYTNYGTGGAFELPTQSGTYIYIYISKYQCINEYQYRIAFNPASIYRDIFHRVFKFQYCQALAESCRMESIDFEL